MSSDPTWLRRALLKNKRLKFLSFILAVLAWYAIGGKVGTHGAGYGIPTIELEDSTLRMRDVPVSVVVQPDPPVSVDLLPPKVNVMLSGHSSVLQKIRRADIRVVVDCVGLQSSTNCYLPVVVSVPELMHVSTVAQPSVVRVRVSTARMK